MNDPKELTCLSKRVRRMIREGREHELPVEQLQALVRQETKELCEGSLHYFIKKAWPILEEVDFIDGWHIAAIAAHLEALRRSEILNLLINQPPGTMKSLECAVFFPAWCWTTEPGMRFAYASYDVQLSIRDSVKCRHLIESPWYQELWGDRVKLVSDQNMKTLFQTTEGGWRLATSVGGRGTGEHPDIWFVDDAMKAGNAESQTEQESVIDWWCGTISTRGRVRGVRRGVVGQRLVVRDLPGYIIEHDKGEWDKIILPMRYEEGRMEPTRLGWTDPRTEEGELLWPEAFPEKLVAEIEKDLGSVRAAAQLQQRPTPRGGGMFKRHWFEIVDALPRRSLVRVRAWDKAATQDGGAYSVGLRMMLADNGMLYIEHVVRAQVTMFGRHDLMKQTAKLDAMDDPAIIQAIEKEGGSGGKDAWQMEVRLLRGYSVVAIPPKGDKEQRAFPVTSDAEAGNIKLLRGEWNQDFLDEIEVFPKGRYKDQTDALSLAHSVIASMGDGMTPNNESFLTSGEFADEDLDKPFTPEEFQELPEYLQEILTEMNASAEEKRNSRDWKDPEDDVWRDAW